ncbi:hypothetical protein Tco_0435457 [Tanacetum coccineum]
MLFECKVLTLNVSLSREEPKESEEFAGREEMSVLPYQGKFSNLARRYGKLRRMLKIALPQLCISLCPGKYLKKGKLAPRFVGPFEITGKIGPVAYRLRLPEELNGVHDTFHVSNLKKCLADPTLQIPLYEIQVNAMLNFVEEPVEILEGEFKKLKPSRIAIVKVRWNSKQRPEFTWERKDQMKLKFPHLFSSNAS